MNVDNCVIYLLLENDPLQASTLKQLIYSHYLWVGWAVLLASASGCIQLVAILQGGLTPMSGGLVLLNVPNLSFLTWFLGY